MQIPYLKNDGGFRPQIREALQGLASKPAVKATLASKGGYNGSIVVHIKSNEKEFEAEVNLSDSTRFPARIKAVATELRFQEFMGAFTIKHDNGSLEITRLPATMNKEWSDAELDGCVRAYMWMLEAESQDYKPVKAKVRRALLEGPLKKRTDSSIEFLMQNISSVLSGRSESWIEGYKPKHNMEDVNSERISKYIDLYRSSRHCQILNWAVKSLPQETVARAVEELVGGADFDFPDSTDYDVSYDGVSIAPKKIIGYAGYLHFGAPLNHENFKGGEATPCFRKLRKSGLLLGKKTDVGQTNPETTGFRMLVESVSSSVPVSPPIGADKPVKKIQTSIVYVRDPKIVAFVEARAKGVCELCNEKAPFLRRDGSPFLEVHHIKPLSENGSDSVENAAALCPNCHRKCHYSSEVDSLRASLAACHQ